MNAAPCSWRASTNRMRESASESRMSRISSPGRPNTYWTPSFSRQRTIRSDAFTASGDPDRLDVHEFPDAVFGQLTTVAGALDPTERQARIGLHDPVHEHHARLDLRGQAFGPLSILRPHRGAEAELRVVRQTDRVGLVLGPDHRGHWSERLLVEGRHALGHLGEQRRRIERTLSGWNLATQEPAGAAADGLLDLPMQRIAQID